MQLSSYNLKVIAIVSMVIDHIGIIFFPQVIVFRIIGRIAFPIFAFLIAEGSRKTSSKLRYSLRLLMFAFVSYIPYNILFYNQIYRPEGESLNIFFTLFFGLILIFSWKYFSNIVLKIFSVISILLFSFAINLDYGIYGVLLIPASLIFLNNRKTGLFLLSVLTAFRSAYVYSISLIPIQLFVLVSLFLISKYNGIQGKKMPFLFFYWFYPFHLVVLYIIEKVF